MTAQNILEKLKELYSLLYSFPREVGDPARKIVKNLDEFLEFIKECTSKSRPCYVSVYQIMLQESKIPLIDRIFLDFDAGEESLSNCLEEVLSFSKFLESLGVNPLAVFSGMKGFHIYFFFDPVELKHPKESITKLVDLIIHRYEKEYNTKIKYLDRKVIGDIRRLARIPYTVHEKSKRAAIIVRDLNTNIEEILKESQNPTIYIPLIIRNKEISYILKYIDQIIDVELKKSSGSTKKKDEIIYLQLPCIKTLLTTPLPPGKRRMVASKFIAIAYYYDHDGSMDGFETIAELFAERQKIGHSLRRSEVLGWKRGVYLLNNGRGPQWNCAEIREYFKEAFLKLSCLKCPLEKKRTEEEFKKKLLELRSIHAAEKRDLLREVKEILDYYIVGEDENKLLLFLLLLEKQNIIIKGPPSTGKSRLVEEVLKLFPEEDIVIVSGATKKFLRWMDRNHIPILYFKEMPKDLLEEVKGEGLAMDIKLAMSDKTLKIFQVDSRERKTVEKTITVDSVVMTTTDIDLPLDIESRVWILAPDMSPEQTKKVLLYKAKIYSGEISEPDRRRIEELKSITRSLRRSTKGIIPGAEEIAKSLFEYAQFPRVRRDIEKIYLLVLSIAKIRGRIYELNGEKVVIAAPEDVELAFKLARNIVRSMVSNIDMFTYTIYHSLKQVSEMSPQLTAQTVADILDIPQSTAEEYLEKLVKAGLAVKYRESNQTVYRLKEIKEKEIELNLDKIREEYSKFMKRILSGEEEKKQQREVN